jgi:hypothetical protein
MLRERGGGRDNRVSLRHPQSLILTLLKEPGSQASVSTVNRSLAEGIDVRHCAQEQTDLSMLRE